MDTRDWSAARRRRRAARCIEQAAVLRSLEGGVEDIERLAELRQLRADLVDEAVSLETGAR